jgi:hypothetical protein
MGRSDRSRIETLYKKGTLILMGVSIAVSIPMLFLWILGVPGVQNTYARGWSLGLRTLYRYFVGSCTLLISYAVIAMFSRRFHIPHSLNLIILASFWIFFIYSMFNLVRSIQIMISAT